MQMSMFSSEERLVNRSQSRDFARAWLTRGETSCSPILPLLQDTAPVGWYGKTSPASCRMTEDGILEPFSGAWMNSGILHAGECLTLSLSEWTAIPERSPRDAGVCSLSDILETGPVPQRYFLSARACRGILRRAAKRGKALPELLKAALESVATQTPPMETEEGL